MIGASESYQPALALTLAGLARHRADPQISVAALGAELGRLRASPIVLNRKLREAVLAAIERDGLSVSEIALRCGRVKRDRKGNISGETSWLARRLGLAAESGAARPTPWVHSDVLALIARSGLGLSPPRGRARVNRWTVDHAGAGMPDEPRPILLIESHRRADPELLGQLRADGYRTELARSAEHARALARLRAPRMIVLGDLGEERVALELLEEIREGEPKSSCWTQDVPVIVLGTYAHEVQMLRAFEAGADDFIARPIASGATRQAARAAAQDWPRVEQRAPATGGPAAGRPRATGRDAARNCDRSAPARVRLLAALAAQPERVFAKDELLRTVWGYRSSGSTRTVDSHASRVRCKLARCANERWVINVRGVGYRLR